VLRRWSCGWRLGSDLGPSGFAGLGVGQLCRDNGGTAALVGPGWSWKKVVAAGRRAGLGLAGRCGGGLHLVSDDVEVLWRRQGKPARRMCCSNAWWEGARFARLRMKIMLRLRSEPVTTALAGVASLLGGITEECWHLPNLLRVVSPG
jgi:hypothetical protein